MRVGISYIAAAALGVVFLIFSLGAIPDHSENVQPYLIGKGGDSPFNRFEVYTFRHNQHRCFVAVKEDATLDMECP
jgi:hypothetical protein